MRVLALLPLLLPWVLPVAVAAPGAPAPAPAPATATADRRSDLVVGLEVLHRWDARRAAAWAVADEHALRSLYIRGSAAGDADATLLRTYTTRRIVVRRLVTQVFAVRVLHRDARTIRLRVFDRVAGGEVEERGRTAHLRSGPPLTRNVELRLVARSWRVAAVRPVSGSERDPRGARR